jgi:NitT/TauT family transport system permease protein
VLARYLPSVVLFSALLAAWQIAGPAFGIREYLLPGPLSVARAAIPWPIHVWITTVEIVGGFVLAGAAGVALGVAIAWSPVAARALVPFLVFVSLPCPTARR